MGRDATGSNGARRRLHRLRWQHAQPQRAQHHPDDGLEHDKLDDPHPPGHDEAAAHDHGRTYDEPRHNACTNDRDDPHDSSGDDRRDHDDSDDHADRHLDHERGRNDDER